MVTAISIMIAVACLALLIVVFFYSKNLERQVIAEKDEAKRVRDQCQADTDLVHRETQSTLEEAQKQFDRNLHAAHQDTARSRAFYEAETSRVYLEAQAALAESQKLIDSQSADLKRELDQAREACQSEAHAQLDAANTIIATLRQELEPLRKYAPLVNAELEAQRKLADALKTAADLQAEAQRYLDQAKDAASDERAAAVEKATQIRAQADARLNQALHDAGRIVAEAEQRAKQIAGDAYTAMRDKQTLEQAAVAMRNIIEGYGDRYLVPTHSVLDDFAEKFGYDEAGQALKSAREQSRRMVEQGEAATCDYVETSRKKTAIQFVIHAFNGSVDSILTRVLRDANYGTLEQQIRDTFAVVNNGGSAFRDARILPAYLDARLSELKWVFKVQELATRLRDEQRAERERMRDEERAREQLREAAREAELKRAAVAEAQDEFARATAELNARHEQDVAQARQIGAVDVEEAEKRYAQEVAQLNAAHQQELQKKQEALDAATRRELTIAQQTRQGHIYIISNEGSFGPNVHKIGFTRREVEERVDELYDASVPFEFDIHAVITTENAPELEYQLHSQFLAQRVNKQNFHKEFFRAPLAEIRKVVEALSQTKDFSGKIEWRQTEAGCADEWRESQRIANDPEAMTKWLEREQALADEKWQARQRRLARVRHAATAVVQDSVQPEEPQTIQEAANATPN